MFPRDVDQPTLWLFGLCVALIVVLVWRPQTWLFALPLLALSGAGLAWLFKANWETYPAVVANGQGMAKGWIDAAQEPEERSWGCEHLGQGTTGLIAGAAFSGVAGVRGSMRPMVNIDGTAMVEGADVDIYGRLYGVTSDAFPSEGCVGGMEDGFGTGMGSGTDMDL